MYVYFNFFEWLKDAGELLKDSSYTNSLYDVSDIIF